MTQKIDDSTPHYTYGAENRMTAVSWAATATFGYDGNGVRGKAVENGVNTVYIGDYYEPFQGRWRSITRTNGVLTWLLGDHLPLQGASRGSTTITANADGSLASEQTYTACPCWGAPLRSARARRAAVRCPPTANTPSGCRPGQISEEQLGIYFYNASYYAV
jgi:hypothetical protein